MGDLTIDSNTDEDRRVHRTEEQNVTRIAVIGGDGIGPEVTAEAVRCLKEACRMTGAEVELIDLPIGAERYLAESKYITESEMSILADADAILVGAAGDPRVTTRDFVQKTLWRIIHEFGLFISVRPIRCVVPQLSPLRLPDDAEFDFVIVREASEDVLVGEGSRWQDRQHGVELSYGLVAFSRARVEKTVRHAFGVAAGRDRCKRVDVVQHSNIASVYDLWLEVAQEIAPDYPDVELTFSAPDAAAMHMIKEPDDVGVIATSLMFGGIFADLGAQLSGGIGLAPSKRISGSSSPALYEPVHGSAPKYAGKGVVSPLGAILSAAMLLEDVGLNAAGRAIGQAVDEALRARHIRDVSAQGGQSTQEQGEIVAALMRESFEVGRR